MTNNTKKRESSPMKKLIPAAGMLMISATMLATSTFAWFTMNKDVTVTGLQMQAKSEDGLVIAAYTDNGTTAPTDNAFTETAMAYSLPTTGKKLLPTFTADATTWYHSWSREYNNGQAYGSEGYNSVTNSDSSVYYLVNKFKIKSITDAKNVYVKDVEVTNVNSTATSTTGAYDDSIRVLIKSGSTFQIFNKSGGTWVAETALASTATSDAITSDVTASPTVISSSIASILNATTSGTDVEIYVYYDGEDPACKSSNIASFDNVQIKVTFTSDTSGITNHASGGVGGGG